MFHRVLIANRGEIALRIIRTLREMRVTSIAAFSEADRQAPFVEEADESFFLGPSPAAQSYLNIPAILEVAREARADAVHPGYGFLAENAGFAEAVRDAGLIFVGPPVEAVRLMGDKVRARQAVHRLGVPIVPGTDGPVSTLQEALTFVDENGLPVAVKAAGGGGGRGIRVVRERGQMADALEAARREAGAYFGNPDVYLERYFDRPRHVEIQVLGDTHGALIHLGERDCSVQRRHQKLIEESPSPAVSRGLRERMGEAALNAARSARYASAGTVEFLLDRDGRFYFLEMNTRIQVEHPVTEMVSGVDLIRAMVLIAAGEELPIGSSLLDPTGHAIEVRVNAEDPSRDFRPTPATITAYSVPGGPGTRVDSGVRLGFTIPQDYDSLIQKVITWAPDRDAARRRMLRALGECVIAGPATTVGFAKAVLEQRAFERGDVWTTWVEEHLDTLRGAGDSQAPPAAGGAVSSRSDGRTFEVQVNRKLFRVQVAEVRNETSTARRPARTPTASRPSSGDVMSPMHGTVLALRRGQGDFVRAGETLVVIEAMKMENEVPSPIDGRVTAVDVNVGDSVELDQRLAVVRPGTEDSPRETTE